MLDAYLGIDNRLACNVCKQPVCDGEEIDLDALEVGVLVHFACSTSGLTPERINIVRGNHHTIKESDG